MRSREGRLEHQFLWTSVGWVLIALIIYLSLGHTTIPVPGQYGDKYGHVVAYATVMYWFAQIYSGARSRSAVAAALAALGVALEFVQGWTGYRTFEYADMIADVTGIVIGWLLAPPRTFNLLERLEHVL